MLTHADFFAGIGVFSLAARELSIDTKLLCEWNEFCQVTLRKNFPGVPIHSDITNFNPYAYDGAFDLVSAGVPCPPFSRQGQRKAASDERDRFPDLLRVVAGCRPRWVIIENVPGLLDVPTEPGQPKGSFFRGLLRSFTECGYMGEWLVLSAAEFGLPQYPERLFIIAYPHSTVFNQQPTAWAEQIRGEAQRTRTNSAWRGSKSRVAGSHVWLADGVHIPFGVKSGDSTTRRRREALGNTICLPAAYSALQRVLYLNSLWQPPS